MKNRLTLILLSLGLAVSLTLPAVAEKQPTPAAQDAKREIKQPVADPVTPPAQEAASQPQTEQPQAEGVGPLYKLDWVSINGGGTTQGTSTNFELGSSIGQSVAGNVGTSTNYELGIGFWYGAGVNCLAKPGDANNSNTYTIADLISILKYIFNHPGFPACPSSDKLCWLSGLLCRGDWNGSGVVSVADVVAGLHHLFGHPGSWAPVPRGVCCK